MRFARLQGSVYILNMENAGMKRYGNTDTWIVAPVAKDPQGTELYLLHTEDNTYTVNTYSHAKGFRQVSDVAFTEWPQALKAVTAACLFAVKTPDFEQVLHHYATHS